MSRACLSVCLSVCLSFCLHFCKTVTVHLCLCVSIHLSVCVCLSMSVFLPSCLPVNHIHSSFTMVLWQSLYNPGVLCLWSLSWMSTLCAVSLLSLMSTRMFLILIHSSLENIRLLNIAWYQINYDDSSVYFFTCHGKQSSGHHIADLLFSLCCHHLH